MMVPLLNLKFIIMLALVDMLLGFVMPSTLNSIVPVGEVWKILVIEYLLLELVQVGELAAMPLIAVKVQLLAALAPLL